MKQRFNLSDDSAEDTPLSLKWYCIRTQTRREQLAASHLRRQGEMEVFCPRIRFRRQTRRGRVWFEEALFPGYLFARFDLARSFRFVSSACGVRGVVQFGGEVLPVPSEVIETLAAETGSEPVVIPEAEFTPGDRAVLTGGAMEGFKALVTRVLPGGERVKILMEIMGTSVEAEVPADTLEKVA